MTTELQTIIDQAWDDRDSVSTETTGEIRDAVETAINLLDSGKGRVASN